MISATPPPDYSQHMQLLSHLSDDMYGVYSVQERTCLTAMLKRGGILNSASTAANRTSLPRFADADVFATASHFMLLHA